MILLDTCTLLWLADPSATLPAPVKKLLRETPPGQRFVSAISAFEIALKYEKKVLELPMAPHAWLQANYRERGLSSLPVTDQIACVAAALPPLHKDPADRIIVASALLNDLTILTNDAMIKRYPGVRVRWGR